MNIIFHIALISYHLSAFLHIKLNVRPWYGCGRYLTHICRLRFRGILSVLGLLILFEVEYFLENITNLHGIRRKSNGPDSSN